MVNREAPSITTEAFSVGREVPLEGAFLFSDAERTEGFSVTVLGAVLESPSQYLKNAGIRGVSFPYGDMDDSVLAVKMLLRNEDNEDGAVNLAAMYVITSDHTLALSYDFSLWELAYPQADTMGRMRVKPGTALEVTVPYSYIGLPGPFETENLRRALRPGRYTVVLSNQPVSKTVELIAVG